MSKAVRSDEALWTRVKNKILQDDKGGPSGKWSARKAQLSVLEYKSKGGTYIGPKSPNNSLTKWTDQKWGYIDGKKGNRYLPEKVRNKLTNKEKNIENTAKKTATKKGESHAKYSPEVTKLMREFYK